MELQIPVFFPRPPGTVSLLEFSAAPLGSVQCPSCLHWGLGVECACFMPPTARSLPHLIIPISHPRIQIILSSHRKWTWLSFSYVLFNWFLLWSSTYECSYSYDYSTAFKKEEIHTKSLSHRADVQQMRLKSAPSSPNLAISVLLLEVFMSKTISWDTYCYGTKMFLLGHETTSFT